MYRFGNAYIVNGKSWLHPDVVRRIPEIRNSKASGDTLFKKIEDCLRSGLYDSFAVTVK